MNTVEAYSKTSPYNKTEDCARFTINDTTTAYKIPSVMVIGDKYTVGMWIASDGTGEISISGETCASDASWGRYEITFTATSEDLSICFNTTDTYYIYNFQLEAGNKATDWSPAPEDVESDVNSLENRMSLAETKIIQNSDQILLRAVKSEVDEEFTNYYTKAEIDVTTGSITQTVTSVKTTAEGAQAAAEGAQSTADTAVSNAATAQAAAEGAQSTADTAVSNAATAQAAAEGAQSTADTAVSNAATAQTTADNASSDNQETSNKLLRLESQVNQFADSFELVFSQIADVNDAVTNNQKQIEQYFVFSTDGLEIGETGNPYKVIIDEDSYGMYINGVAMLWFDGDGKGFMKQLEIQDKLSLFGLDIQKDASGNINCS